MEEMIKQAANIGIDYIKFQSFRSDRLNKNWPDYQTAYEYYKSVELSDDDHVFILQKCCEYGIKPLFTVFDIDSARNLFNLGMRICKIASPDADNVKLVDYCIEHFRETIISSGMINTQQARVLKSYTDVKLLYCVSRYPAPKDSIDFDKMQMFDGFSDHTEGITAAKKAIDLGMQYIERHFTLGKYLPGKDHFFSSTPDEFKELVDYKNYVEKCKLYKTRWNNG
jgi:N,N'-diacetyllegionaminate synthase